MTQHMRRITPLFLLLLILLMAAAVRIINIDGPALWTDEGFTYYTFKIGLWDALIADRHPPFYFYTLHAWVEVAGDSILAMRYWSFLPSMMSIAVMFQLGRELTHYRPQLIGKSGLLGLPVLAALMMALTDGENYLAQELRMYSWHVLFASLSTLFYLKYFRTGRQKWLVWWGFMIVILVYTHYFGAFVAIVQGIHALIFMRGKQRFQFIVASALSGLAFAPWFFAVTLEQFGADSVCVNCAPPDNWTELKGFPEKWFGQMWPLTVSLFLLGLVTIKFSKDAMILRRVILSSFSLIVLLVGLIVVPTASVYVLGHEEVIFFAHRLSQITIPIVLLLALGLSNFPLNARGILVVALIFYGVTTVDWYRVKVPWHEITEIAAQYVEPDELVFGEVGPEESALLYYLDHLLPEGTQNSTFPFWSDLDRFTYYEQDVPALIAEQDARQMDSVKSAWVIYFSKDDGYFRQLEAAGYTRTMTEVYQHINDTWIDIYRYDKLPETVVTTYQNGMILGAAEIQPDSRRIDLWWSTDEPLSQDYVISAFLLDSSGQLVAQYDTQPFYNQRPTTTFSPGEVIFDPHPLELSAGLETLPSGEYSVGIKIYEFTAEGIQDVLTDRGEQYYTLAKKFIQP